MKRQASQILFQKARRPQLVFSFFLGLILSVGFGVRSGLIWPSRPAAEPVRKLSSTLSGEVTPNKAVEKEVSVRVQLSNEPVSLDPTFAEDGVALQVLANLHEGLVGYDSEGKLENRIARSYQISENGKRLEFEINPERRWSDGRPIEVADFLTAFRRSLGPSSVSKLAPLFYPIRNAQSYHQGRLPASALGVKEENGKLVIELEKPAPYFLQALVLPGAFPLRQDVLDAHQGRWPETAPTSGPYRISSHQMDREIWLERNPGYLVKSPRISRVQFLIVSDESTGLNLFQRGQLDIMTRIPLFEYPRLKAEGRIHTYPFYATYYIGFNCRKFPFQNPEFRKEVARSIQRKEVVSMLGAGEIATSSWIPNGLEGFRSDGIENQVEKVSALANQLQKGRKITLGFDSGVRNSQIMEKIQQDLKVHLGVGVSLQQLDWRSYIRSLQTDPPDIFRFGWLTPFGDPVPTLQVFKSGSANNYTGCSSAKYDALVGKIEEMRPSLERAQKIREAQKILLDEEAMIIPIYQYVQNLAVSSRIKNFKVSPFGSILFRDIDLNE